VANRVPPLPDRSTLGADGLAGLNSAVASVPDGLASGLLAGVNPIFGLYACMAGPIAGGIFSSTQLLVVATTSASALAAGQALAGLPGEARADALFLMVLLIGIFQILFGVLRLGRMARFVSYSGMTGFLTGIAALTILSQLPTVTGFEPSGSNRVAATFDLLLNVRQTHLPTLAVSALTLVLALFLPRTRLGNFGTLAAIAIPSVVVALLQLDSIQVVRDFGAIPRGLPTPFVPSLSSISGDVITGALAVAVIVLVQGAGVSQSVPNPDGSRSSASRDFIAQGAANVASGLFRGLPVGGSLSTTALSVLAGARTRWAAIFAGVWIAVVVVALPDVVAYVAMPALGVLLIVASASAIKPEEVLFIWNTGWPSRLAIVSTLLATLFLPIQAAVGIGVVLSAMLYLYQSSTDLSVVEVVQRPNGRLEERTPPKHVASNTVTVLDVYGHLYYAGVQTLSRLLPRPEEAKRPVVVLRMRGRTTVGATLIDELSTYAERLKAVNGRLYLTGIGEHVREQMVRTGRLHEADPVRVYAATPIVGESTRQAIADARTWLVSTSDEAEPRDDRRPSGNG
jgi:SulP family sulfate permease